LALRSRAAAGHCRTAPGENLDLLRAAGEAVAQYPRFHGKALAAGAQYQPQASWAPLVERLRAACASA